METGLTLRPQRGFFPRGEIEADRGCGVIAESEELSVRAPYPGLGEVGVPRKGDLEGGRCGVGDFSETVAGEFSPELCHRAGIIGPVIDRDRWCRQPIRPRDGGAGPSDDDGAIGRQGTAAREGGQGGEKQSDYNLRFHDGGRQRSRRCGGWE